MQDQEAFLLEQAIKRDRNAFSNLYDKYSNRIYLFSLYRTSNPEEAKDITQEVFLRAWKKISAYKVTGVPFISWLSTIARHLIIDNYKASKRQPLLHSEEVLDSLPSKDCPELMLETRVDASLIKEAVAELKGDKQKVVIMRYFDDRSYAEIARALNKNEGAVRVLLCRALRQLKRSHRLSIHHIE